MYLYKYSSEKFDLPQKYRKKIPTAVLWPLGRLRQIKISQNPEQHTTRTKTTVILCAEAIAQLPSAGPELGSSLCCKCGKGQTEPAAAQLWGSWGCLGSWAVPGAGRPDLELLPRQLLGESSAGLSVLWALPGAGLDPAGQTTAAAALCDCTWGNPDLQKQQAVFREGADPLDLQSTVGTVLALLFPLSRPVPPSRPKHLHELWINKVIKPLMFFNYEEIIPTMKPERLFLVSCTYERWH